MGDTWWGRIAATDLIFDVEREKIIYAEELTDGSLAYQQYLESCPIHGCKCVKKKETIGSPGVSLPRLPQHPGNNTGIIGDRPEWH